MLDHCHRGPHIVLTGLFWLYGRSELPPPPGLRGSDLMLNCNVIPTDIKSRAYQVHIHICADLMSRA